MPRLGAHPGRHGTRFGVFSTTAAACAVRLFDVEGRALETKPLEPRGHGFFATELRGVGPGALYKFVLEERELPDPYARFLPFGVHGPALVHESRYTFRHGGVSRPLREHVLYELHVGTFSPEGTYRGALERLPALVELGVTAIELMPVHAFAGGRGWGYDGVALFAPFAPYGPPDELRAFVDEAHGLGLAVFLDVVYNHFGPAGNYLAAYSPAYFTSAHRNGWGDAPNYAHPVVRKMVLDNARMWLEDYRVDGLRLDATHAIVDPSPEHVLTALARDVAALRPRRLLVAEDDRNDPTLVTRHGLHGIWADDFHHAMRVTLTAEQDGYYAAYRPGAELLAETIAHGWLYRGQVYEPRGERRGQEADALPAESFVYCIQNHDQVGNRALGDRLSSAVSIEAYCVASTVLLFLPMTPLLFMGQEWAASTPFRYFTDHEPELGVLISQGRREEFKAFRAFADPSARAAIPDPQAEQTFVASRLDWSERTREPHARVLALYRRLLALRREDPVLRALDRGHLDVRGDGYLLIVRGSTAAGERVLLANLAPSPVASAAIANVRQRPVLFASDGRLALGDTLEGHRAVIVG